MADETLPTEKGNDQTEVPEGHVLNPDGSFSEIPKGFPPATKTQVNADVKSALDEQTAPADSQ